MRIRPRLLVLVLLAPSLSSRLALAAEFVPPACDGSGPGDVDLGSPFCPWVQQFTLDQISAGCGGGNYCPDDAVTRQQLAVMMERAMRGTATWDPARGVYLRTIIVHPVPGNTTASGTALLAAMASITGNSASNPWLLKIEPGIYDLGGGALTLKPFVDVEGSGELVTTIRSSGSPSDTTATVVGATNCQLRFLTIENTGGNTYAKAMYNSSADPFLAHVTLTAKSADYAVTMRNSGSSPILYDVSLNALFANTASIAMENTGSSFPLLARVRIAATSAFTNVGIDNSGASPILTDVSILVNGSGGTYAIGVSVGDGSSPTLRDSSITAQGGGTSSWGIHTYGTAGNVTVEHSVIYGGTASIDNATNSIISVAGTRLDNPPLNGGGGTYRCFGNYNGFFAAATCP